MYFPKRKYSAFIEYVQCISEYHDTCVHVHNTLARNDSIPVITSGIDFDELGFRSSLA
jgi:hypothetical protein